MIRYGPAVLGVLLGACQGPSEPWYRYFGTPLTYIAPDGRSHHIAVVADARSRADELRIYLDGNAWRTMNLTILRPRASVSGVWPARPLTATCAAYTTDTVHNVAICEFTLDGEPIGTIEANRIAFGSNSQETAGID